MSFFSLNQYYGIIILCANVFTLLIRTVSQVSDVDHRPLADSFMCFFLDVYMHPLLFVFKVQLTYIFMEWGPGGGGGGA